MTACLYSIVMILCFLVVETVIRERREAQEITVLTSYAYSVLIPFQNDKQILSPQVIQDRLIAASGHRSIECLVLSLERSSSVIAWPGTECQGQLKSSKSILSFLLPEGQGTLSLFYSFDWLEDELRKEFFVIGFLCLASGLILFMFTAFIFHHFVGRRVDTIITAMSKRRDFGELKLVRLEPEDEFGQIAQVYNEMLREEIRRKNHANKLKNEKKFFELREKALLEILSNVGHEIRTPLNTIVSIYELLKRQPHSLLQADYIGDGLRETKNLSVLMDDLVTFTELDFDRRPVDIEKIKLFDLIQEIEVLFVGQRSSKTHVFCNFPSSSHIRCDRAMLRLLIRKCLDVCYEKPCTEHDLALEITLDGSDIVLKGVKLSKSEDRFSEGAPMAFQEEFRKQTYNGLIVNKLIVKLKGQFEHPDQCCGDVRIPVEICGQKTPLKHGEKFEKKSILLVDDSPTNLIILQSILDNCDYTLLTASSGESAIEVYCREKPDLILMDLNMPKIDGFEATDRIFNFADQKSLNRPIIIPVTGNVSKPLRQKCFDLKMAGFVSKPLFRETLLEQILLAFNEERIGATCAPSALKAHL
ncbi:MAG: response regulator [Sneathiella sp.]